MITFEDSVELEGAVGPPEDIDVVRYCSERLGFVADGMQEDVLRCRDRRVILNCCRQWGKSTVAAVKAIHRAATAPGSLVLVASPSERQSGELLRKASELVQRLGFRVRGDGDNEISLMLPNGSRMVGLPGVGGTVRGFSAVSLMVIDEAAQLPDAVYKSLRPMLAVGGGDLWLLSTPYGRRGFFYDNWEHGGAEWTRFQAPATECARIPAEFLEEERRQLGNLWFRQEYLCEFVDNGAALFDRELVEGALSDEEPLAL